MLRLSQKAWNNVVIFAMLFMLYLFTVSSNLLQDGDDGGSEIQSLFPPYSVVMSMDFGVVRLERIGQDWRVSSALSQPESQELLPELLTILDIWSKLEAIPFVAQANSAPYVVTVLLAGEDKKRVYQVFQHGDDVLLQMGAEWFLAEGVAVGDLLPIKVLN